MTSAPFSRGLLATCVALVSALLPVHECRGESTAGAGVGLRVERILGSGPASRGPLSWLTGRAPAESSALKRPYGVAWDRDSLLVTDPAGAAVRRIDRRGRVRSSPLNAFAGPIGVAVCPSGIVVSDSRQGAVTLLDARLRPTRRLAEGLLRPTTVLCDASHLFVVETGAHRILQMAPDGTIEKTLGRRGTGEGEFNFPSAAALDGDSLWIGDTLNFRVQQIRISDGSVLHSFGRLGDAAGETPRVKGLAVDRSGRLWVSDAHLDNVAVFDPAGRLLLEVGTNGGDAGQFSFPAGLAIHPDGRLAIADSLNQRIQIVRLVGAPNGGDR